MGALSQLESGLGVDPLSSRKLEDGIGLCLSGGGFKAASFHLGALIRLNELGMLGQIDRISSVSGGSIVNALLGLKWSSLLFDNDGVATNFEALVSRPLLKFAQTAKLDVGSAWSGVKRWTLRRGQTAAQALSECYNDLLYSDATLQDFPLDRDDDYNRLAPRFIINASSLQHNSLWRMSKRYIANHRVGVFDHVAIKLADAVAASSAFPPVLSPAKLDLGGASVRPGTEGDLAHAPFNQDPIVADAGIYDNLGIETIWKRYRTLLVSNAGDPFSIETKPSTNWLKQSRRVLSMMHRNEENHRIRWLISMAKSNERRVALWSLRGRVSDFNTDNAISLSEANAAAAASQSVRLDPLSSQEASRLVNHGYSLCDASIRKFIAPDAAAPGRFPIPEGQV